MLTASRGATKTSVALRLPQILERITGNPVGIAVWTTDNVVALMARHLPSPAFNSVVGLQRGQAHHVRPLVDWYRKHGLTGRFEITAGDDDPALGHELARLGFYQSGCHAALIGEPDPDVVVRTEVAIESVANSQQMEEFLAAYVLG